MARVLVLDGEQAITESMALILSDHGHEVRTRATASTP